MDLSVSYIYGEAKALSKKHGLTIIGITFISMVVSAALMFLSMPEGYFDTYMRAMEGNAHALKALQQMQPNAFGAIAQYIVSFFLSAVLYRALIGYTRGREMTLVDAFKVPAMTFLKFIGTIFVVVLATVVGLVCLIIPGIYVAVRLIWAPMYIVEYPESSIKDAIVWSWRATAGHWIELFCLFLIAMVAVFAVVFLTAILGALGVISSILSIVAILVGVIGMLGIIVWVNFAQTKTYCELTQFVK